MKAKQVKTLKILRHKFINYLYESGFHLFCFFLRKRVTAFIEWFTSKMGLFKKLLPKVLKKHIKNYIQNLPSKGLTALLPNELLEVVLKGSDSYFGKGLIEFLDAKDIDLLKDDVDTAYFPFKNGIVKITKDGAKLLSYGEVGKGCLAISGYRLPH